jgi:hypothetical protein
MLSGRSPGKVSTKGTAMRTCDYVEARAASRYDEASSAAV